MQNSIGCTFYEQDNLRRVTGETIRPGGLKLTERALSLCRLSAGTKILDVGCGTGASLCYMKNKSYKVYGIDASWLQLQECTTNQNPVIQAWGESLPIASGSMDVVLIECTLSLIADLRAALCENYRILSSGGWFIITDIYARNEQWNPDLRQLEASCGFRNILTQQQIGRVLQTAGFEIVLWEDHSHALQQITGQIIMTYGSLKNFWDSLSTSGHRSAHEDTLDNQLNISKAKPGYYLVIAHKT